MDQRVQAVSSPRVFEQPLWAFCQTLSCRARPGGWRHKFKKLTPTIVRGFQSWGCERLPGVYQERQLASDGTPAGNLKNDEYRFFYGLEFCGPESMYRRCRCCRLYMYAAPKRKLHLDQPNNTNPSTDGNACTVRLVEAYRKLLRASRCVVCSGFTSREKWGVPLCSAKCIKVWKFGDTKPLELLEAALGGHPEWINYDTYKFSDGIRKVHIT